MWAAVLRESPHMRTPFDTAWFDHLLSQAVTPTSAEPPASATRERREDWGDAPDTVDFVGRRNELTMQRSWILEEHCRLVAVLGIGGIGKTNLAARLAEEVAPGFECVYWRSLRDAPPPSEWLAGAISFLVDVPVISPATAEMVGERRSGDDDGERTNESPRDTGNYGDRHVYHDVDHGDREGGRADLIASSNSRYKGRSDRLGDLGLNGVRIGTRHSPRDNWCRAEWPRLVARSN